MRNKRSLFGRSCTESGNKHITVLFGNEQDGGLSRMSRRGTRRAGWVARRCDRNDGHTVDALALDADEGRGHATKCAGEALAAGDPAISEWGNPAGVMACQLLLE